MFVLLLQKNQQQPIRMLDLRPKKQQQPIRMLYLR